MREIFIDLSPDNHLQEVKVFGGYSGEQNETLLKIKLPQRMISNDFLYYYFKFETDCNEEILSVPIPCAEITDSIIEIKLWKQLTKQGLLKVNVVASNGLIIKSPTNIAMTNTVILVIKKSPNGQEVVIDPNAVEVQLLKLIDERVVRDLQNLGELAIDQTYKPKSVNAQSGKAVAEAVDEISSDLKNLELLDIKEVREHTGIEPIFEENLVFDYTGNSGYVFAKSPNPFIEGSEGVNTYTIVVTKLEVSDNGSLIIRNSTDGKTKTPTDENGITAPITKTGIYTVTMDDTNGIVLRYQVHSGTASTPQKCYFKFKIYKGDIRELNEQILPDEMLGLDSIKSLLNTLSTEVVGLRTGEDGIEYESVDKAIKSEFAEIKNNLANIGLLDIEEVREHTGIRPFFEANEVFDYTGGAYTFGKITGVIDGSAGANEYTIVISKFEATDTSKLIVRNYDDSNSEVAYDVNGNIVNINKTGIYTVKTLDTNGIVLRYALTTGTASTPQKCYFKFKIYKGDVTKLNQQILPDEMLGLDSIKPVVDKFVNRNFLEINKHSIPIVTTCFGNITPYAPYFRAINVFDLHGTFTSLDDAFSLAQKYNYLNPKPVIINAGDMIRLKAKMDGVINEDVSTYIEKAVKYGVYHTMGQHEVGWTDGSGNGREKVHCMTHEEVFTNFIEPMKTVWGLPDNHNTIYYNVDINKTRLISLYQFEMPLVDDPNDTTKYKYGRAEVWYSQEQLNWFINTLNNTPENYDIIILKHKILSNVISDGSKFFMGSSHGSSGIINGDPIADIVSAYINRTTINNSYKCNDTDTYPENIFTVNVNADFSNAKGIFRNYYCGDSHIDHVGKLNNYRNQLCIGLTSSSSPYDCVANNRDSTFDPNSSLVTVCGYTDGKILIGRIGQQYAIDGSKRDLDILS